MQTFVSHNENRDLGWSLMCLGRIVKNMFASTTEPCPNMILDVEFYPGHVCEHVRFFLSKQNDTH